MMSEIEIWLFCPWFTSRISRWNPPFTGLFGRDDEIIYISSTFFTFIKILKRRLVGLGYTNFTNELVKFQFKKQTVISIHFNHFAPIFSNMIFHQFDWKCLFQSNDSSLKIDTKVHSSNNNNISTAWESEQTRVKKKKSWIAIFSTRKVFFFEHVIVRHFLLL